MMEKEKNIKSNTKKQPKKHFNIKVLFLGALLIVFLGYVSVTLISQQVQISAKTHELEGVEQNIVVQDVKNNEIKNVYNVLKQLSNGDNSKDYQESLNYIERVARENYDYSRQGERIFVNIAGE